MMMTHGNKPGLHANTPQKRKKKDLGCFVKWRIPYRAKVKTHKKLKKLKLLLNIEIISGTQLQTEQSTSVVSLKVFSFFKISSSSM